jgi:hypothetical protein
MVLHRDTAEDILGWTTWQVQVCTLKRLGEMKYARNWNDYQRRHSPLALHDLSFIVLADNLCTVHNVHTVMWLKLYVGL